MTTYAIIVTYNGSQWIDKCLSSLESSSISLKILVVDNGSTDNTIDIIQNNFPQVELIISEENLGFGKANNIGLKRVLDENADYALLLNQDAWAESDTIEKLIKISKANSQIGVLSPIPYNGDGTGVDYLYKKFYKNDVDKNRDFGNLTYQTNFINAACWLITKEVLSDIGGFHPHFFMYGEDVNYLDRIKKHNKYIIAITESTKYFHDRAERESIEQNSKRIAFKTENKIKVNIYNPNISKLVTLRYYLVIAIKNIFKKDSQGFKWFFVTMKYCFLSINNRKIKYPL